MMEFHQTLQTPWYPQDEHVLLEKRARILLELLPFVILNGFFLYIDSAYARKSTCTALAETMWYFAHLHAEVWCQFFLDKMTALWT